MENWGLIIGRTSVFLIDPNSSSLLAKKNAATTQSHEVAHMWWDLVQTHNIFICSTILFRFGNITTIEWWDYLYLKEGLSRSIRSSFRLNPLYHHRFRYLGMYWSITLNETVLNIYVYRWARSSLPVRCFSKQYRSITDIDNNRQASG